MSSKEYANDYRDKWNKNDFKARIYETLINSYKEYIDDTAPKAQYGSEPSNLYSEDLDKLAGLKNFDLEWISRKLEGDK